MMGEFWTMVWHTWFLRHKAEALWEFENHLGGGPIIDTRYGCECGKQWWG